MGSFILDVRGLTQFFTAQPALEIWNNGFLEDSSFISSVGIDVSVYNSYASALSSSSEFRVNNILTETDQSELFQSVKINDRQVNIGNYLSIDTPDQETTAKVYSLSKDSLFETREPKISMFKPSDKNFTRGNDSYTNYGTVDHKIDAQAGRDIIRLGSGIDRVYGNDGDDVIYAGEANDLISGGKGADRLYGQEGDDKIYGGKDNDRLYGQEGNDALYGGAGDDVVLGHNGHDVLFGEAGNDRLTGGNGDDVLYADVGDDILRGGNDNDTLDGGAGSDLLYGGAGDDIMNGGAGDDMMYGNIGNDVMYSNEGNNTLDGFTGNDILQGGAGINLLEGGADSDIIYSGAASLIDNAISTILSNNSDVVYNADTNSFYKLFSAGENWADAHNIAQSLTLTGMVGVNGHLVSITTQTVNDYIESMITTNTWIGGSDAGIEGEWIWSGAAEDGVKYWNLDGAVNGWYSNWDNFQPTNSDGMRDYASINTDGLWDAQLNTTSLAYIVEWDATSLITTEANVTTMNGGTESDTLYGSDLGVDFFVFETSDALDRVYDFDITNRDQIDISALLSYDALTDQISDFVQLVEGGGNTTLSIDSDGTDNGSDFVNIAELDSVTGLDIATMIAADNLIV